MASTYGLCSSFKTELLNAYHNFAAANPVRVVSTVDVFKGALYLNAATLSVATTVYSATNEVANSGSYAAGGQTITNASAPALSGTTACWTPSGSLSWTTFSATGFDTLLIYNSSQGNRAVGVFGFSLQTITAGTFTLTMPATNTAGVALLQLA